MQRVVAEFRVAPGDFDKVLIRHHEARHVKVDSTPAAVSELSIEKCSIRVLEQYHRSW